MGGINIPARFTIRFSDICAKGTPKQKLWPSDRNPGNSANLLHASTSNLGLKSQEPGMNSLDPTHSAQSLEAETQETQKPRNLEERAQ
jgi:hypothetical protein